MRVLVLPTRPGSRPRLEDLRPVRTTDSRPWSRGVVAFVITGPGDPGTTSRHIRARERPDVPTGRNGVAGSK